MSEIDFVTSNVQTSHRKYGTPLNAYKIVLKEDDDLVSVVASSSFKIYYRVGELITSDIGKLFVFRNLPCISDITTIVHSELIKNEKIRIFKCRAYGVSSLDVMCDLNIWTEFDKFWKNLYNEGTFKYIISKTLPPNTVLVSSVILTEDITDAWKKVMYF